MIPNYKWSILRHIDGVYAVTGYILVNGAWEQHGQTLRWAYIDGVLEHIRKVESDILLSRT